MRFSLTTANGFVLASLLAGCSSMSLESHALPGSSGTTQPTASQRGASQFILNGRVTSLNLLELQAEGKMPGPMPVKTLRMQLKRFQSQPRPHFNLRPDVSGVHLWTSMTYYNYLFGTGKSGTSVKAAINTYSNQCEYPIGVKVDHSQNIWTACQDIFSTGMGAIQEYSSAGSLLNSYNVACPLSGSYYCASSSGYGFDGAANVNNVFFALTAFNFDECKPSCNSVYGGGFEWWPAGSPSSTPTLIALPSGNPVYSVYYMDLDSSGNIWFDYYGYEGGTTGYGLGEITNPTSPSWSFVDVEKPGTYAFAGGVYVSNGGTVLNVIDQNKHIVNQYNLPLSPGGTPFNVSGPTGFGLGDPVTGGFNSTDTKMAIGDAYDWLDIGKIATNTWRASKAALFVSSLEGAAYTPSDK